MIEQVKRMYFQRRSVVLALVSVLGVTSVHAANYYVRPNGGAYGTESGADWNNAFDGFSGINWSAVTAGDTIWVAGGTYTQSLTPGKSGTSSSPVSIRRARTDSTESTGAAGWSSSFAATIHQVRSGIRFNSVNYVTVSGRTTSSGGDYGWWIDFQGATSGTGIEWPNGATGSNILVEYFDVQGPGVVNYTSDGRGIDDTPFTSATNHVFSHMAIHDWESGVYVAGTSNATFEYLDMYDIWAANPATFHPNGIYTASAPGGTVRYSRFHRGPKGNAVGEGIFFEQSGGSTGWLIYGNVFYDINESGKKAIQITSNAGNIRIFNNTFDNTGVPGVWLNAGSCGSGAEVRNNLGYQSSFDTCGTKSDNVTASSTSVWVNRASRDYRIVSTVGAGFPRDAGVNLSTVFALDAERVTYGADGKWDAGAYEFAVTGPIPMPPTAVRVE